MTTYRPTKTGLTGGEIAQYLDGVAPEGVVLLERGLVPMGEGRPVHSWAPPAAGSVRLDPLFWLAEERAGGVHSFMAFGVVEAGGPPVVEVVDDGPMPVLVQPPQPVFAHDPDAPLVRGKDRSGLDAANDAASVEAHRNGVRHLSRVMAPEEIGRRVVADLLADVEHHGAALVKALDEAIEPSEFPGVPRFVFADSSVRMLKTLRSEVEAVLQAIPGWGADRS